MKKINTLLRIYFLSCVMALFSIFFSGCGVLNPPRVDSQGYYLSHYDSCGPIAVAKALNAYAAKNGIKYKRAWNRKEISQDIQSSGNFKRSVLVLFNSNASSITWPSEIKKVVRDYGFKIISINEFKKLNLDEDVAIVLVYNALLKGEFHWVVYPIDKDIKNYFGDKTEICYIFLIKRHE
ncbi:MAG TPA: hypothetical protein EYN05_04280 [Nitrospinaceae bacterium]|nr:hypothetical protein [Nitrospinaceae bacterium]